MRTISIRLEDLKKTRIHIGYVGENEHTQVRIDSKEMFKEYPTAEVSMALASPAGSYPKTVTRDGDTVVWNVTNSDLAAEGDGELQLSFTENGVIAKSYRGQYTIMRSVAGDGEAPDPIQDWMTEASEALEDLEAAEVNQPVIGEDGYWYTWDQENGEYVKTDTKAQGEDGDPGQPGTDATPDLITKDYADLTFPVAKDSFCYHDGKLYQAKQDIQTSEQWTAAHWTETTVEEQLNTVKSALQVMQPAATNSDIGKALIVKTVADGVPTSYEYGEAGGVDPSVIAEAVDEWLDDHPEATTTVEDGSITDEKLASALAEKIGEIDSMTPKSEFNAFYDSVNNMTDMPVAFENDGSGYITYTTGDPYASTTFDHTDYIDLTNIKRIKYKRTKSTGNNPATGMAFYDASKHFLSGVQSLTDQADVGYDANLYSVDVPVNAKYARFSIYKDTTTYGSFALYSYNELAERFVFKNDKDDTVIHYSVQKTNDDGTKTIALNTASNGRADTIIFTPIKNTNYAINIINNDRLRIYGANKYYDPSDFSQETVAVEIINESENLRMATFNSGEYKTIFIYCNSGVSTHDPIEYTLTELNETQLNKGIETNFITGNNQSDMFADKLNGVLPDIPSTIPATAILYHAEWDDLVEKGLVERSDPTYVTGDTDHLYPLYTYTIKTRNQYMDSNYDISENELSTIYARPKILIVSGHHGDEPCTPWALLGFVKRVLEGMEHYDLIAQYEWTIIPLVNPYGFNARSRYNAASIDINRDYNDASGFHSEEAQYVRDVFLDDDYAIALDLHQTPFNETTFTDRRLGFTSMNIKRASETQDEYDALRKAFLKNAIGANARTDVAMMVRYGWKDIGQTSFLWESSNATGNTFKNYTAGTVGNTLHTSHHTKITATLETSTRCAYLSGMKTDFNDLTVQYTNEYVDEIIRAVIQTYEDVI